MASRIGPVDQGLNGKTGEKVDEVSDIRTVSRDSASPSGLAKSPVSTNNIVGLTMGATMLERLEKLLASVSSVDSARVAEIKAAIENGDYQIDADAIADAMIRLDRSLGE